MARSPYSIFTAVVSTVGELRERIRLDARVQTTDEMGGQVVVWQKAASMWAKVTPLPIRSAEQVEGGGIAAVGTYIFVIRRRTDLEPTMRIVWPVDPMTGEDVAASLQFNMRGVNLPSSRDLYMAMEAESGVAM